MAAYNPHKPLRPGEGERVECHVVIQRTPAQLYALWQDLEALGKVFVHVESIAQQMGGRSHWVVKDSLGARYEWDAEVVNQVENEHIGWQSLPGGDLAAAGSVHFHPAGDGATELRVLLRCHAPDGAICSAIGSVLQASPAEQIAEDLQRLKNLLEGGAVLGRDAVQTSDSPASAAR